VFDAVKQRPPNPAEHLRHSLRLLSHGGSQVIDRPARLIAGGDQLPVLFWQFLEARSEGLSPAVSPYDIGDCVIGNAIEQGGIIEGPSPLLLKVSHGLQLSDAECPWHEFPTPVEFRRFPPQHEVCLLQNIFHVGVTKHERADEAIQLPLCAGHTRNELG
jgi:hypothetical protein